MAWSDYFTPDFDDPNSPSYVKTSPYLPIGNFSMADCQDEVDGVMWDFKNEFAVVKAMSQKSFPQRLRDYAIQLDSDNSKDWDEPVYYTDTPIIPHKSTESNYVFTFGKYKGYKLTTVLDRDPSYVEWCRKNVSWFNH